MFSRIVPLVILWYSEESPTLRPRRFRVDSKPVTKNLPRPALPLRSRLPPLLRVCRLDGPLIRPHRFFIKHGVIHRLRLRKYIARSIQIRRLTMRRMSRNIRRRPRLRGIILPIELPIPRLRMRNPMIHRVMVICRRCPPDRAGQLPRPRFSLWLGAFVISGRIRRLLRTASMRIGCVRHMQLLQVY